MRILITGINGFVGGHLANFLYNKNESYEIVGLDLNTSDFFTRFQGRMGKIRLVNIDLTDAVKIEELIKEFKPEQVYHLAAQASVSESWKNPIETFKVNVFGGVNILESIRKFYAICKFLSVCTAEEYEIMKNNGCAIAEDAKISPSNPYAISKSALDFFSTTYFTAYKIPVFVSRSFNHIGPGQSERFVCSDFARQIAEIEKGVREPKIYVGNLAAYRDFLDVRDVIKAYYCIMNKGKAGEVYNICSGEKQRISDLLDILLSFSSKKNIEIKIDNSKLRPIDNEVIYGDNSKLKKHTGWNQDYTIKQALKDTLEYWRQKV
ncbi:MAG: GDP-mannose 4,6-dehydratase [Actinobacteria bacterium]|nr:GDP-mannose 4,6-dehydratase [Actinomycetota bacterium]